jgi:tRNA-Thr(GGU) m(6)t(6)A37 methyltransferase TsaA
MESQKIIIEPVGVVKNYRNDTLDDNWGKIISTIELNDELPPESLDGIELFSHIEVIFHFNKSTKVIIGSEHPRENTLWPKVGIFAQRKKDRPNHLGSTIVKLIERKGRRLLVQNLDAIDGTPVIDIKPVFSEFLPGEEIIQPSWTKELMRNYW